MSVRVSLVMIYVVWILFRHAHRATLLSIVSYAYLIYGLIYLILSICLSSYLMIYFILYIPIYLILHEKIYLIYILQGWKV